VVALNRAVALAEVDGPEAALAHEAAIARTQNAAEREFLRRNRQGLTGA
jgi:predicted RNA polymerase sigma factor